MSQIFKILFQTGEINIFVLRGFCFSRYVQLKQHMGGANIIEWTKEDVKEMDQKTRKISTMYGGLHPISIVEWLHQEGKEVVGL